MEHLGSLRMEPDEIDDFIQATAQSALCHETIELGWLHLGDVKFIQFSSAIRRGSLPRLRTLCLTSNMLGDDSISAFSIPLRSGMLPNLEELNLSNNKFGASGMTSLAGSIACGSMATLRVLRLSGTQLGDAAVTAFFGIAGGSLADLKALDLSSNRFGEVGVAALAGAIASGSLTNLETFALRQNQVGDAGMTAFAGGMAAGGSLSKLKVLHMQRNQIGDIGMQAFSSTIGSGWLPNIEEVYLNENKIGDAGMTAFASAIRGCMHNFTVLQLRTNLIGDIGMTALADSIGSGALENLEALYLSSNNIGDQGMRALAYASGSLGELRLLYLKHLDMNRGHIRNHIGDDGMTALAGAINSGSFASLAEVVVDRGPLGLDHPQLKAASHVRSIRLQSQTAAPQTARSNDLVQLHHVSSAHVAAAAMSYRAGVGDLKKAHADALELPGPDDAAIVIEVNYAVAGILLYRATRRGRCRIILTHVRATHRRRGYAVRLVRGLQESMPPRAFITADSPACTARGAVAVLLSAGFIADQEIFNCVLAEDAAYIGRNSVRLTFAWESPSPARDEIRRAFMKRVYDAHPFLADICVRNMRSY